jgi:hypothetical protein
MQSIIDMERFSQLLWANFSLFLYFTPLYISLIYGVFLNEALQNFDDTPSTYLGVAYFCTYVLSTNV